MKRCDNMGRTDKITISLPKKLISFADEMAEQYRVAEMAEGYTEMAEEQKRLAAMASEIEHEVIPT